MVSALSVAMRSGRAIGLQVAIYNPDIDTDGDGLPNTWETTFGLDPSSATAHRGPSGDPQGEGVTNTQEMV